MGKLSLEELRVELGAQRLNRPQKPSLTLIEEINYEEMPVADLLNLQKTIEVKRLLLSQLFPEWLVRGTLNEIREKRLPVNGVTLFAMALANQGISWIVEKGKSDLDLFQEIPGVSSNFCQGFIRVAEISNGLVLIWTSPNRLEKAAIVEKEAARSKVFAKIGHGLLRPVERALERLDFSRPKEFPSNRFFECGDEAGNGGGGGGNEAGAGSRFRPRRSRDQLRENLDQVKLSVYLQDPEAYGKESYLEIDEPLEGTQIYQTADLDTIVAVYQMSSSVPNLQLLWTRKQLPFPPRTKVGFKGTPIRDLPHHYLGLAPFGSSQAKVFAFSEDEDHLKQFTRSFELELFRIASASTHQSAIPAGPASLSSFTLSTDFHLPAGDIKHILENLGEDFPFIYITLIGIDLKKDETNVCFTSADIYSVENRISSVIGCPVLLHQDWAIVSTGFSQDLTPLFLGRKGESIENWVVSAPKFLQKFSNRDIGGSYGVPNDDNLTMYRHYCPAFEMVVNRKEGDYLKKSIDALCAFPNEQRLVDLLGDLYCPTSTPSMFLKTWEEILNELGRVPLPDRLDFRKNSSIYSACPI